MSGFRALPALAERKDHAAPPDRRLRSSIALCWFAVTIAVVFAGTYGWMLSGAEAALSFERGRPRPAVPATAGGLFATLATFAGIWLGIWIAMRCAPPRKASASLRQQRPPLAFGLPQRPGGGAGHLAAHRTRLSGSSFPMSGAARSSWAPGRCSCCRSSSSPSSRPLPRNSCSAATCSAASPIVSAARSPGRCCRRWSSRRCTGTRHPCSA